MRPRSSLEVDVTPDPKLTLRTLEDTTMITVTTDDLKELSYHVAPEDQGQIIEYAYALDWEDGLVIQRELDRSTGHVRYYATPSENLIGEFEPWNTAPRFERGTTWQRILEVGDDLSPEEEAEIEEED